MAAIRKEKWGDFTYEGYEPFIPWWVAPLMLAEAWSVKPWTISPEMEQDPALWMQRFLALRRAREEGEEQFPDGASALAAHLTG